MKFIQDTKQKFDAWRTEQKEKAEARKALKDAGRSEHMHGRFFLLHVPATATVLAAFVEIYWAVLFCIEATGRLDANIETSSGSSEPMSFIWNFAFSSHMPVLLGLAAATAPIVMISMVWLPVQFAMRGFGRWRRGSLIAVGLLANALVIVSGTVVMNSNRQEHVRDALVVEQTADAGRAAIGARLQVAQTELARITDPSMTTNEARAARAGVQGWQVYIQQAQNDPSVPNVDRQRIERAMGSAQAADALRARIEELTVQQATSAPAAATAATVEDTVGAGLNQFSQQVSVWRPPFVALVCTLIGVLGAWWTLAMLQGMNPRDVLRSGWADDAHRIEDMREQEAVTPQPMKPAREVVTDAETGEELIRITPKPHWRKQKGKKQKVETQPEIPPDETGVSEDGGKRTAITIGGLVEVPESVVAPETQVETLPNEDNERRHEDGEQPPPGGTAGQQSDERDSSANAQESAGGLESSDAIDQPEPPEVTEQEAAELLAELGFAEEFAPERASTDDDGSDEEQHDGEVASDDEQLSAQIVEAVDAQTESPEREPETDPQKLIAAE